MEANVTSLTLALEQHERNGGIAMPHAPVSSPLPLGSDAFSMLNVSPKSPTSWQNETRRLSNLSLSSDKEVFESDRVISEQLTYETAQKLFIQISSQDENQRRAILKELANIIFYWVNSSNSNLRQLYLNEHSSERSRSRHDSESSYDKRVSSENNVSPASESSNIHCQEESNQIVRQALASLLRLSVRCPFNDVRTSCNEILISLKDNNIDVPTLVQSNVSKFIPNDQILPIDTDDEQTYNLYVESFVHNCRLEHMVMVMGLHPQYLKQFLHTNLHLLQAKGVLSYQYRSYIAIMAAARHQCTYLVHLMEAHFLLQGGDRDWLRGLDHVPAKLRALSKLNKLLAHRPWLVTSNHIKELIVEGDPSSRWQHPELAQAIILLCHFHSVAIFCHGAGINLEIDHERAHRFNQSPLQRRSSSPPSGTSTPNNSRSGRHSPATSPSASGENSVEQTGDIEVLMERMKKIQEEEEEEVTREEMNRRFEKEKEEATQLNGVVGSRIGGASYFSRYVIDPDYSYQDFAKRDAPEDIPTFREQDYSWDDSASLMINNYNSEVADLLDDKFKTAYTLTYKTLASKDNVDTSSLRRAIWNYVHCMYGIMYDDYNYGEVNQLLERPLKVFIKSVTCFPEQMKRTVYDGFWKQFRHSEKVHVNIMLLEARLQVGLLYGMRAITEFVSSS